MDGFVYVANPSRVVFANGAIGALPDELARLSVSRALVLCSPGRRDVGERIQALLAERCAGLEAIFSLNVPLSAFDQALEDLKSTDSDGIVVLGGGSMIGLGKALGAETGLPLVTIVTTYSGSEMADNWFVGASGTSRRRGSGPNARPSTVIYDPELTLDLPVTVSAASGMNAMAHAVESLYAPDSNPVVERLATEAIGVLAKALPKIVQDPHDLEARGEALRGAWLAAGFRATSGLEHAMAQRLRHRFKLNHAETHAVVLPYVTAFNRSAAIDAMGRISGALGAVNPAHGLYDLNRKIGIPGSLRDIGLRASDLDEAAETVCKGKFQNPRPAGLGEIRRIIGDAFEGKSPP